LNAVTAALRHAEVVAHRIDAPLRALALAEIWISEAKRIHQSGGWWMRRKRLIHPTPIR